MLFFENSIPYRGVRSNGMVQKHMCTRSIAPSFATSTLSRANSSVDVAGPGAAAIGVSAVPSAVTAAPTTVRAAPPRAFAGWGEDGRELSRALLPAHVCRPVPLRPADVPALPAFVAPPPSRASVRRARACPTDELGDDDVRSVREFVRGAAGWRELLGDWVGAARGYWHRFMSAASRPLELPSLARQYTTACAVHEPPD